MLEIIVLHYRIYTALPEKVMDSFTFNTFANCATINISLLTDNGLYLNKNIHFTCFGYFFLYVYKT
jgi:hypothetical protein